MRPKKKEEEKRTKRQTVNFTEKELEAVKKKAERLGGIKISEYLRISAVKLEVKEPNKDYAKLLAEMARIGSNLNQIAKKVHEHPSFTQEHEVGFKMIYARFKEIKEMIEK